MIPTFEDALMELIDRYRDDHNVAVDVIVSAMELRIMALNEEEAEDG